MPKMIGRGGSVTVEWGTYPGEFTTDYCTASAAPFDNDWTGNIGDGGKKTATIDDVKYVGTATYKVSCTNTEGEPGPWVSDFVIIPFIHEVLP